MAFTIISGGANGVDLEAEKLARNYGLPVRVLIPPCHPRKASIKPLTHQQLAEAIPITTKVAFRLKKQLTNPSVYSIFTEIIMWSKMRTWC